MTYVDTPGKKQKHPHYEHRTEKLDKKNNEFSRKKFHRIRKVSTHKKLLESFGRIGMCLNNKSSNNINVSDLNKVCFILINSYEDKENDLGVGPLNDGYLVGLKHHRLGFKIFYLYNSRSDEFTSYLSFFTRNTSHSLTVFYTGRDSMYSGTQGIEFNNGSLSASSISEIISQSENDKAQMIFITDSCNGGSVFGINEIKSNTTSSNPLNLISFYVTKSSSPKSKDSIRSHGIFTYYFFKIISIKPNITPNGLVERINPSLSRFKEIVRFDLSKKELADRPIFFN